MGSLDLLVICALAFAAVFLLLALLALAMRIIMLVFPSREAGTDATVLAAVTSVVSTLYPGTRVTSVEELK
jgi:hypothetical protein